MALRNIRKFGDPVLEKVSKPLTEVNEKTVELVNDMLETMYDMNGVGLAAVQVGILKRLVVIDVSPEQDQPIVLINPEIIEMSGEQTGGEGCLSLPGKVGTVSRPDFVRVKALDETLQEQLLTGTGLLARAFCHEIDHLDGILYTERMTGELADCEDEE